MAWPTNIPLVRACRAWVTPMHSTSGQWQRQQLCRACLNGSPGFCRGGNCTAVRGLQAISDCICRKKVLAQGQSGCLAMTFCNKICICVPGNVAVGVLALCSAGFLDQEARAALAPPWGKLEGGVNAELYWKPGRTLVSRGEDTAIAALLACNRHTQVSDLQGSFCKPAGRPCSQLKCCKHQGCKQIGAAQGVASKFCRI